MKKRKSVCIFCASSPQTGRIYLDAAFRLGQLLADEGVRVITGGGSMGLMASVEDGVLDRGGHVTAVIPQFMIDAGWLHKGIEDVVVTSTMQERKERMFELSDAFVTLPGGCGTLDELTEVLTLKQLGILSAPVVILNVNGYFDYFLKHLQRQCDEAFMNPVYLKLWNEADTPEESLKLVEEVPEWNVKLSKLPADR